jgi:hypothetical protein
MTRTLFTRLLTIVAIAISSCWAFTPTAPQYTVQSRHSTYAPLFSQMENNDNQVAASPCVPGTCSSKGDDDVSNRFKYKVNALMGVFDPPAEVDHERSSGHILNALLKFPVRYSFHAVGKTASPQEFADRVRDVIVTTSGTHPDDAIVQVR